MSYSQAATPAVNKHRSGNFSLSTVDTIWPKVRGKEKLKQGSLLKAKHKVVFFLSNRQNRQDDLNLLTVKLHIPQPKCFGVVLAITLERNIPPQWQQRVRVEEEWVMLHFFQRMLFFIRKKKSQAGYCDK